MPPRKPRGDDPKKSRLLCQEGVGAVVRNSRAGVHRGRKPARLPGGDDASHRHDSYSPNVRRLRAERDSERVVKRDAQAALRERHSEKPRNTSTKVAHDAGAVDEVADDCAVTRQPSWSSEPAGGNRQIANPGISTSKPSYPASHARSAPDSFAIRGRGGGEVRIMDEVLMYPRRGTFRVGSAKPRGSHIVMIGATSRPLPNNSSTTHSRSNLTERANRMRAAIYGPPAEVAEGEMASSTAPCVDASRRLILEDSFQQTKTNADGVGVAQCQVDAPFPLVVEEAVAGKCKQSATTLSSGCAASARRIRRSSLPTSSDEVIFSSSLHAAGALQGNERDLVRRARQRAEYARHWEAGGGDVVANLLAPPAKVHDCKTPNALDHIRRRVMRLSDASTGSDASSDGSSDAHDITPSERSERRHRHKFARATSNTSA